MNTQVYIPSMDAALVWKAPKVAQSEGVAEGGEQVVQFEGPVPSDPVLVSRPASLFERIFNAKVRVIIIHAPPFYNYFKNRMVNINILIKTVIRDILP
jgi:hypothetical protein